MNLVFNIAVYNQTSNAIRNAAISLMEALNFRVASRKIKVQAMHTLTLDILPEFDAGLILRSFLISPNKNKWCVIYPSTGWFSELPDFNHKLSGQLHGVAMVILQDDSAGWGYEISQRGQVVDRFHTNPLDSPSLNEKREEVEELGLTLSSEQLPIDPGDYSGKPSLVAELFGVAQNKVANHLSKSRNKPGILSHYEMDDLLHGVLGIDKWGWHYQEIIAEQGNDDNWHHLVFVRQMTIVEQKWRKHPRNQFSNISPPLWLNEL